MALSPNINNLEKDKFKDVSGATAVQVSVIETVGGGGGGGTEYTEGATDASITGTAALAEGPSDTLTPLQLDASGNLKVVGTFGGSSSDVTEDAASLADPIGPQIMARRRDALSAETTTDADNVALNATNNGELYVKHVDAIPITDNGGSLTIDGTVAVSGTVAISAASLPLPTGAATAALQTQPGVDIGDVTVNNASGASAVNIQDGGNSITVDGSVTANAGTNLNTSLLALESGGNLAAAATSLALLDNAISGSEMQVDVVTLPAVTQGTSPWAVSIIDGGNTAAVNVNSELSVSVDNSVLPNGASTDATLALAVQALQIMDDWDETNRAAVNTIAGQVGVQGNTGVVTALTQRVVLATDVALPTGTNSIGSVTSTPEKSSTATLSNVAASATSVTVLASNANRKKAIFVNDSTVVCRLKFGATASSTSYTIYMSRGDTYIEEGPTVYTGICDAIWDSATGNMRVTELT